MLIGLSLPGKELFVYERIQARDFPTTSELPRIYYAYSSPAITLVNASSSA